MFFKLFKNYNNVFFHLIPFQILIVENISPNLLKINIKVDDAECFVCFENISLNGENIIKLQEIKKSYFFKKCSCDGYVHQNCFDKWYEHNKNCPICRKYLDKKIDDISFFIYMIEVVYKKVFLVFKIIFFILYIFIFYELYNRINSKLIIGLLY